MKLGRMAAVAALFALAAGTAAAQTTLRIGLAEDPDILDPTLARTYVGRIVFASICDKLFDIDEKLNIVPQLALSHETSPDGKTVTIKLRPGVKFQDGETFDAEAAKYSLERHLTMQGSFRKSEISAIDHIEVVDPLTIRLILKTPYAPLIAQLTDRSGMMVAPNAAKAAGDKFGLHPVCAGPYKFVERVQQDHITVEKFADYWNKDNIHIDRIVYQTVVDASVRLASLKSGGLDIAERLLATDIKDIRGDKKLQLATALWLGYQGIDINVGDNPQAKATPLGRDARVRQALSLAIDRDAINQVVFNGEFVAGNQWVSPANPWYQQKFPVPKRDVAKAKALMAQAGVTAPFSVDFMVPKGDENQAIAEMIQAMAKDIGIDMKIRVTEFATSLKQAESGAYQAFLLDWSGRADPDGNLYSFYICKGPLDYSEFCNPEADKLLNEERTVGDFAARKAVFEKLTGLILEQSPIIYLYHRKILMGVSTRVEGYKQVPDGMIRVVGLKLK
jgi:peptide/nickel transport system substrate-binding protein